MPHVVLPHRRHAGPATVVAIVAAVLLAACGGPSAATPADEPLHVGSLKGPTTMGLVGLMDESLHHTTAQPYAFAVVGTPDALTAPLATGDLDAAFLPVNVAATLYSRTDGGVRLAAVTTLGVLHAVSADTSITSVADLAGRTVFTTGRGATPQRVIDHLLDDAGIADDVTVDYRAEATEAAAMLVQTPGSVAVLPEPFVTAITAKHPDLHVVVDLNEAWLDATGVPLVTAALVVRSDVPPDAVAVLLDEYADSVELVNEHPDEAAPLIVAEGILDDAALAERAIPRAHLVDLRGPEARRAVLAYLDVLERTDPASIGGSVPDDGFFVDY